MAIISIVTLFLDKCMHEKTLLSDKKREWGIVILLRNTFYPLNKKQVVHEWATCLFPHFFIFLPR